MSLKTFQNWVLTKESSPATRSKQQAALGLGPDYVSVFGRSTPAPWVVEKLTKNTKKKGNSKQPKYKLPGEDPPEPVFHLPEKNQNPDYSFDQWLQKALEKSKELEADKKSAEEEDKKLNKEIDDKLKQKEDKDVEQDEVSPEEPSSSHSQDDKNVGRETKWSGHKKEQEDREKAGINSKNSTEDA